jgi:hypothetical protein
MLISVRNNLLLVFVLVSLLFFTGLCILLSVMNFQLQVNIADLGTLTTNDFWFLYSTKAVMGLGEYVSAIASTLALLAIGIGFGIAFRNLFKRTITPEIFFFCVFLLTFCFDAFRFCNVLFILMKTPVYYSLVTSRIVYFGRLLGMISLLVMSLYSAKIKYQGYETLIGLAAIIALTLTYSIPIDSTVFLSNLLYKLGDETGVFLIFISLEVFTLVNLVGAAVNRDSKYYLMVPFMALVICGREILNFQVSPVFAAIGVACLFAGSLGVYRRIDKIYF